MKSSSSTVAAMFLLLAGASLNGDEQATADDSRMQFFENRIRPVLVEHCYECHAAGATIIQAGLRLDNRDGLLHGGDTGAAIVPEQPEKSLLLQALRYEGLEMPPDGKLSDSVIQDFEKWIAMGAPDPRLAEDVPVKRTIDIEHGRQHWAFRPVDDPPLPSVQGASWPYDPADRFILAKLEQASLHPVDDADRYTWLRRVTFDLTGLPPSPAEMDAFVSDRSDMAFRTVVDRLLNSPAFGERWARHWLDLTGYADQVGTSNNVFAEHAWRYRDYLIDAFNNDKPFDRFLREQIAGDLLPMDSPEEQAAGIVATGFLVLGDVEIVNPDKLKMEADLIDQQVSKVGMVFMGMTLGCARCHDHKFDPVGLEDYYGMAGIFRSTSSTHKIPRGVWSGINTSRLPETPEQIREREDRVARHNERLQSLIAEQTRLLDEKARAAAEPAASDADRDALTAGQQERDAMLRKLATEIEHARFFAPQPPQAFAVCDSDRTGDMQITIRGNPYTPGRSVPRGVLRVAAWDDHPAIPAGQSGRLQLADWLADPRHPLTARVAVNRIWQKLFGEGIVRSVDYFGTRGDQPSHPQLLDHLAARFMREGWSQKRLIRALVLTHTYRLSSRHDHVAVATDPDNRLMWRMNRQRLDAEALRDAMLSISGELIGSGGGPALPLEFPENTGSLNSADVNPPSFSLRKFRPAQEFERTIYLPVVRSAQPSPARLRDLFDFTQPAQMAGQRAQTVVPTQALFLLNNELLRSRARRLADDLVSSHADIQKRVEWLWLKVLNRPITSAEQDDAAAFLKQLAVNLQGQDAAETIALTELCHALLSSNEFLYRL